MDDLLQDFIAETREGIEALDSDLVRFEQDPDNPELLAQVFRLIHTIKGACGFVGLSRLQAVAHAGETVLGGFRDGSTAVTADAVSAVLDAVDVIRAIVETLASTGEEPAGDDHALICRLEQAAHAEVEITALAGDAAKPLLERLGGEASLDAACEMAIESAAGRALLGADFAEPFRLQAALRDGLVAAARGFGDGAELIGRVAGPLGDRPTAALLPALLDLVAGQLETLDIAPAATLELRGRLVVEAAPAAAPVAAAPTSTEPAEAGVQTIRVGVDALEHLMTVASELVLIRNQLLQLLRVEPESAFAAPLHRLNQVTSELQEGVMTTRMQPISGAWAKLPRLVRDLARDLGKSIDLQLHGQDTELDRQVLELIKDPLTHMIRNAADHGIEAPADRRAAGKAETGRIGLSARHEGGAIVIEMSDDGRGLNAARIRAKAVSSGVVTAQQAEQMSDAEARRLIFLPGFSTAAEVTAVSGRGVGMDVVRTNIERIGGVIEVASAEGAGIQFTIRIPLTLTIVSALIVECCGERFAMPQSSVVELVSANDASGHRIEHIDGAAVLRLRDRLLPLVSLQALLGLPVEAVRTGETCIVVAKVGAFTFGVIVDRVFDTEEIVVKPVASVLRHIKAYSGATILGDGSVILILDLKGLSPDVGAGGAGLDEAAGETAVAEREAILLFRAGEGAPRAAPLAAVARIEEVEAAQIEHVDGRSVIQYRGRLTPVIQVDGAPVEGRWSGAARPLLVFTREDRSVGVVVDEIVDIVEASLAADLAANRDGAAGSLIIGDQAVDLIDVGFYWRAAMGEPAEAAPAPAPCLKRLLVVDQSPFSQLLLRPLLAQAGYDVTVAADPDVALAFHDRGEGFDLILADTGLSGPEARRFAERFAHARAWHATPLLGLGLHRIGGVLDETTLLDAVAETLVERRDAA